jgi:hypothetical protein
LIGKLLALSATSALGCVSYGDWHETSSDRTFTRRSKLESRELVRADMVPQDAELSGTVTARRLCADARYGHVVAGSAREKRIGPLFDVLWGIGAAGALGAGVGIGYGWAADRSHDPDARLAASLPLLTTGAVLFFLGPSTIAGPPKIERQEIVKEAISEWGTEELSCGAAAYPVAGRKITFEAVFPSGHALVWHSTTDDDGKFSTVAHRTLQQVAAWCGPPRLKIRIDQEGKRAMTRGTPEAPARGEAEAETIDDITIAPGQRVPIGQIDAPPAREVAAGCAAQEQASCKAGLEATKSGMITACEQVCAVETDSEECLARRDQCVAKSSPSERDACATLLKTCLSRLSLDAALDQCLARCVQKKEREKCPEP